jgi:hypothetical protein
MTIPAYTDKFTHGCCSGMPNELYHAHSSVSLSKLKVANESLLHYHGRYVSGAAAHKSSDALRKGSAQHVYTLEGEDAFNAEFVVVPNLPYKKKEEKWDAILAMNATLFEPLPHNGLTHLLTGKKEDTLAFFAGLPGLQHITAKEFAVLKRVDIAVKAHPIAADLLSIGMAEVSFRSKHSKDHGYSIQCRPDWLNVLGCEASDGESYFTDLKTVASLDRWDKSYYDFGYWLQEPFYKETMAAATGKEIAKKLYFIVAEMEWPFRVVVRTTDPEHHALGLHLIQSGFAALTNAYRTNNWQTPGWDEVQDQTMKGWAIKEIEESI